MNSTRSGFLTELARAWQQLWRDPLALFAIFLVPLLTSVLLLYMMHEGVPRELPLAVVDEDHSSTSRSLVRSLDAFPGSHVALEARDMPEALSAMRRGEVYGIYHLPAGLQAEASSARQPKLHYYTNSAYLLAGSFAFRDMKTLSELASASVLLQTGQARGLTAEQILASAQPITVRSEVMSNPWLNYSAYLTTTILPGMLQLMIFLFTAYSLGMEVKRGSARSWLERSGGSMMRALLSKLLPQTALFLLVGWSILIVLYGVMGFPLQGSWGGMVLAMALLVLAAQSLGIFFFALLPITRMAMSAGSLLGMLSFSISGMSLPVSSMYPPLQMLAYIFPLRHYYLIGISQGLFGAPWSASLPQYLALCTFLLLPLLLLPRLKRFLLEVSYLP